MLNRQTWRKQTVIRFTDVQHIVLFCARFVRILASLLSIAEIKLRFNVQSHSV